MKEIIIRDIPITKISQDYLELNKYATALVRFIENSETPFTISLQGELGSGKSSLMNLLVSHLRKTNEDQVVDNHELYECIWINTWELNLLEKEYNILDKLSASMIKAIQHIADERGIKIKNELDNLAKTMKKLMVTATDVVLSANGVDTESRDKTINFINQKTNNNVAFVRGEIEDIIMKLIEKKGNNFSDKGIIFLIDDLDRIEPSQAISILEGLKNLFDVKYCMFVLSVDYDIIVKGLKTKYQYDDEVDEEIYNSYFDKLIQLPFVMPMIKYDIEGFVIDALVKSNYFDNLEPIDSFHRSSLIDAIKYSFGKNPRSIKRLINSAKLSKIYDELNDNRLCNLGTKVANLYLLCLQMEYPKFYEDFDANEMMSDSFLEDHKSNLDSDSKFIKFIEGFQELIKLDEDISIDKLNSIVNLSSMTFMPREIKERFTFRGEDYDKSSQTQYSQGNKLIQKIKIGAGKNVLDIGCGNGKTTIELWQRFQKIHIDAFDFSSSQIKIAHQNLSDSKIKKHYINPTLFINSVINNSIISAATV